MDVLLPENFFFLEEFSHKGIFESVSRVWEVLLELLPYFQKNPLGKIEIEIPKTVYLVERKSISIGRETIIEPGAYIQGPAIIGPRNLIRSGAYLRGGVITGERCTIGHGTEIKHSILLDRAQASHFNYIGDSIIGNDVNLGAGVKVANMRLDKREISIFYRSQKIKTTLQKLGAVIGDRAQLGCNSVTNPGVLLEKESLIKPGSVIFASKDRVAC